MRANRTGGIFSGLSASPTGYSITGDYTVSADVWMNFIGPAPVGGSGSTQAGGMGIGTAGTTAQWAGGTQDSVSADGNSAVDWRAYSTAAPTDYGDASTVFFAAGTGNRNHSHAYYAGFGGVTIPAAQTALFPATQTGTTLVGSAGFKWHRMVISKVGNFATWTVSGTPIARVDLRTVTLSGSNIFFNAFDTNATSSSTDHGLNFTLVDNVVVTPVPEPASMLALGLGAAAMLRRRRKA